MFLVSIGGTRLLNRWHYPKLLFFTLKALRAAKRADGNLGAEIFQNDGVFFALSAWQGVDAMKAFAHSGVHRDLMISQAKLMSSTFNLSYENDGFPSQKAARLAWLQAQGKAVE